MVHNTKWIGIGVLSAVLIGVVIVGCSKQNSNPDTATPVQPVNTATGTGASSTASTVSFDDAANTWGQVEAARTELDTAIKARKLDQVHESATKIGDLVKTLPDKSAMLPEDKRKTLDAQVKNVGELAAMMNKSDGSNDMKSDQEHQTAMNGALDMIKETYPAEAMHSSMQMHGKGMGDKMRGMGKHQGPNGTPMPGGGMGGDR